MTRTLLVLLAAFSVFGCGKKAVYDNVQIHNRQQCARLPPSQYEDCMEDAEKTYEEYRREREEALKQDASGP
ncbi:hypothetical protein PC39_16011 [Salinisphaera sp. PC39]|uniref:hypothetical protein n=1 Tax=Salinisphaera sp. PC39 TaxID=1304156 RepID=UPI00333F1445